MRRINASIVSLQFVTSFFLCSTEALADDLSNVAPKLQKAGCSLLGFVELPMHDRSVEPGEKVGSRKTIPFSTSISAIPTENLKSWKELIAIETGYETEGAVLCEQRRDVLGLLLANGKIAYVNRRDAIKVDKYPDILKEKLMVPRGAWDGKLWTQPAQGKPKQLKLSSEQKSVLHLEVKDFRTVKKKLWVHVGISSKQVCTEKNAPVSGSGWIPAFSLKGEPAVVLDEGVLI